MDIRYTTIDRAQAIALAIAYTEISGYVHAVLMFSHPPARYTEYAIIAGTARESLARDHGIFETLATK